MFMQLNRMITISRCCRFLKHKRATPNTDSICEGGKNVNIYLCDCFIQYRFFVQLIYNIFIHSHAARQKLQYVNLFLQQFPIPQPHNSNFKAEGYNSQFGLNLLNIRIHLKRAISKVFKLNTCSEQHFPVHELILFYLCMKQDKYCQPNYSHNCSCHSFFQISNTHQ